MAMNVFNLFAKITLDRSEYTKELNQAEKETTSANEQIQDTLDESGKSFGKLGEAIAVLRSPIDGFKEGLAEAREENARNAEAQNASANMLKVLQTQLQSAKTKVADLNKAFNESVTSTGEDSEETKRLADELRKAQGDVSKLSKEIEGYSGETKKAEGHSNELANAVGEKLHGAFEKTAQVVGTLTKTISVGFVAGAGAVGALAKQATSAYADFEQLSGGIETLYNDSGKGFEAYKKQLQETGLKGKELADELANYQSPTETVMQNASKAYMTAGKSANEYMETVIGMTASLNKATGDVNESARLADLAITDMSDNVNKLGTSMEGIENAYRGFSRGNFSMLDNLALGYAGSKEGMEELLKDAQKISGVKYDISSYADMVEAIHVVQEEMGITGTTMEEASKTISGSIGMMKSAWANLVAGFADPNADLGALIGNFVESAKTAGKNLLPAVKQSLGGIAGAIGELAPIIATELPGVFEEVLPGLLEGARGVIDALVDALPTLVQIISDNLPTILETLIPATIETLVALSTAIIEQLPELIGTIIDAITTALSEQFPQFEEMFTGINEIIHSVFGFLTENGDAVIAVLGGILGAFLAFQAIEGILKAVTVAQMALNLVMEANPIGLIVIAVAGLVAGLMTLWQTNEDFRNAVQGIWEAITGFFTGAVDKIKEVWGNIGEWFGEKWGDITNAFADAGEWFSTKFTEFKTNAVNAFSDIKQKFSEINAKMKEGLNLQSALQWGKDLIANFINGIKAKWEDLKTTVKDIAGSIKDLLGFSEPKEGPLSNFHTYAPDMMDLFMQGIKDNKARLLDTVSDAFDFQDLIGVPTMDANEPAGNGVNGTGNTTYIVNVNQPVESTEDMAEKIRIESQYGLIMGQPIEGGIA